MITAIVFDLDDTLIDHTTAIEQAAGALFDKVLPDVQPDARRHFVERWKSLNRDWYQKFYAQQVTFQESGRGKLRDAFLPFGVLFRDTHADAILTEYYEKYVGGCRAFADVISGFSALRKFTLGVVTNGQEQQQVEKIKRCELDSFLNLVVTSESAGFAKPDLRIFAHACASLELEEHEVAYVGDSLEIDAIPASRAGLTAIWLNRRDSAASNCPSEIRQIRDLTALVECLPQ